MLDQMVDSEDDEDIDFDSKDARELPSEHDMVE
jgi:hypothetical protein